MSYANPAEDAVSPERIAYLSRKVLAERERLERKYSIPVPFWYSDSETNAAYAWQNLSEEQKQARANSVGYVSSMPSKDIGFSGVGVDGFNYHNEFRPTKSERRLKEM